MTESERTQIIELWESGMSLKKIRRMTAMSSGEFRKTIDEMRKNGDFGGVRTSTVSKVVTAFDEGVTNTAELAKMYGLRPSTVQIYLRENGRKAERKKRVWEHTERTLNIVKDIKDGNLTQYAIAKKYGVSLQYISKIRENLTKGVSSYER